VEADLSMPAVWEAVRYTKGLLSCGALKQAGFRAAIEIVEGIRLIGVSVVSRRLDSIVEA